MPEFGLGRLVRHDPRSRAFPADTSDAPIRTRYWTVGSGSLDQGALGSCTGNAMAHWINAKPAHKAWTKYLIEADAVRLYSEATLLDPWEGAYPPDDTGSSGLAVAQAAKREGLISSYTHAFGFDHMLGALQLGPVLVGTNWYDGFTHPDSRGYISVAGDVVGGHEYCVNGVNTRDKFLWATNSWSAAWGVAGRFKIPYPVMQRLLAEDGDVTVPVV